MFPPPLSEKPAYVTDGYKVNKRGKSKVGFGFLFM